MAVLPKPQAVSPAQWTPCLRAMRSSSVQRKRMSRTPSTQSAKMTPRRSPIISASSWTSLPPTDSMLSSSAPAAAQPSKVCQHGLVERAAAHAGRAFHLAGVVGGDAQDALEAVLGVGLGHAVEQDARQLDAPGRVLGHRRQGLELDHQPGRFQFHGALQRAGDDLLILRRTSGMVVSSTNIGGRVKFSSG